MCIREAKSIVKHWVEYQSGIIKSPKPELGRTLEALDFLFECLEQKEDNMFWISINQRIPENTNRIITWDGQFVQEGHYSFIERRIIVPSFKSHNVITHWMPLPEPPKK